MDNSVEFCGKVFLDLILGQVGLKDLTRIEIEDNISLETVQDIRNTADIELIQLVNNPNLSDCNIELIYHNISLDNIIEINNNTEACTYEEILSQCIINVSDEEELSFEVFPNPTQRTISSTIFNDVPQVTIINMFGIEQEMNVVDGSVDLNGFSSGMYIIRARNNDLEFSSKVIKL